MSGEKVYTAPNIKQQMQIDLSILSQGIYLVKVGDSENQMIRLIKE